MADAKTDYAENLVLQYLLTTAAVTRPTTWFIGLLTAPPTDNTTGTELTGGSYARKTVGFTVSGGQASNGSAVQWTGLPAGTVTHFAIYTAATAGQMLYYGPLADPKTLNANDTLTLPAGDLDINEN